MEERKTGNCGQVIQVDAHKPAEGAIRQAARIILRGGVVAYPTESFYGLGVDAGREEAVARLFQIKRREERRPILILIPSVKTLDSYVTEVPKAAQALIRVFWPGGLTLIFHASGRVLPLLTAGTGKIGVRLSSHLVAGCLARAVDRAITGTSANISGAHPCRSKDEVLEQLGNHVDAVLDGGLTSGRNASTVLDVTTDPPKILREGLISRNRLEQVLSKPITCSS